MPKYYWIRQRNDEGQGPFSADTIRRYVSEGRARPDMWFSEDRERWRRGAEIPDLFPAATVDAAAARKNRIKYRALIASAIGVIIATLVSVLGGERTPPTPLPLAEIIERASESITLVGDGFGVGTGFLVAEGIVATNAHVTRSMFLHDIELSFAGERGQDAQVLGLLHDDEERDLCLLRVQTTRAPLRLGPEGDIARGTELLIIGNPVVGPEILENVVTRGLAGPRVEFNGAEFIQISASINPGNSGGPVLGPEGRVLAVATAKSRTLEGVGFGVPVDVIRHALRNVDQYSSKELAKLELKHDVRAAFVRLEQLGRLHAEVSQMSVAAGALAIKAGLRPTLAVQRVRQEASPHLMEATLMLRAVQQRLPPLTRNADIAPSLRAQLRTLWDLVVQMDQLNRVPLASLSELQTRAEDCTRVFKDLKRRIERGIERGIGK